MITGAHAILYSRDADALRAFFRDVLEFPSVDAAVATHDSEAYQEALRALGDGADRDLRVVPGWEG